MREVGDEKMSFCMRRLRQLKVRIFGESPTLEPEGALTFVTSGLKLLLAEF